MAREIKVEFGRINQDNIEQVSLVPIGFVSVLGILHGESVCAAGGQCWTNH